VLARRVFKRVYAGDMRLETTGGRRADPTTVAGWMAVTFGAVHVVVVPLRRRANLSPVSADGWWNAPIFDGITDCATGSRSVKALEKAQRLGAVAKGLVERPRSLVRSPEIEAQHWQSAFACPCFAGFHKR
jgi:hypothetical protein